MRVGVIGLGIMGQPMAMHLHKAGLLAAVYNRTRAKAKPFEQLGVYVADSPADLAKRVDVVIEIVSDAPDVEQVFFGPSGVAEGARPGLIVVDMSTNSPEWARRFAERFAQLGVEFLDAPVTGGQKGAVEGALTIMVGGKEEVFKKVLPVFQAFGKQIVYMGPVGYGQAMKLVNQIAVALNTIAMVEAVRLAKALGLDMDKVAQILTGGAARSGSMELYLPKLLKGDLTPGFKSAHLKKDLVYALEYAHRANLPMPATALALELYKKMVERGLGELGIHALGEVY
ncbi:MULTISPECIES: NAD(P)-dependent oxidoreductase [Pyrobaculum]|uniref:6-phosphogluconate dehydrogenase, NAD-binding protein n=2 Tax=Pyrobaculum arsenaticum TaxID=121277 RepID=A4WHI4_PYRAR|nr:NAD(P)-dependent oxidoreductase [Pyrobaculum arsenaticum]ABP49851.1 6-phosphogluconate dehydrogenase, NAD-binding protein [Pyrobaculum arsenaticum DSM 13514]NYR15839.1 NAD(P)-dependent oxidoreductase [Pyrobaculum arsenaticum]